MTSLVLACLAVSNPCFVQKQVVRQQVVPYVAPVQYFVGAPLRMESLIEQQKRSDPEWQEFLQFKAFQAGLKQQEVQQQVEEAKPVGAVTQYCAKCHGKADPESGFFLDGSGPIPAETITKALRMIATNKMPKGHPLTKSEKNLLVENLLSLEDLPQAEPNETESLPPPIPESEKNP